MDCLVSYLILDYNRPLETKLCLESIKNNSFFGYKTIFLCNGGDNQDYAIDLYKQGFIDKLILRKDNSGCGNGTVELAESCETKYFIYVQSDQILGVKFSKELLNNFINLMENQKINYIDLSGNQGGGKFTERAGILNTEFYKSIPKGEKGKFGGPGPFNNERYVESYVQEFFQKNNIGFPSYHLFIDNGKWSIREMGDGIYKHSTDEKKLFIIKKPTYKTSVYPPLNNEEWNLVLNGDWIDGTIPEEWKNHSFKIWD